MKLLFNL